MVVLANVATRLQRKLGDPQLISTVELGEEACQFSFEFDLGHQTFGVDLNGEGNARLSRYPASVCDQRGDKRQSHEALKDLAASLVALHDYLLYRPGPSRAARGAVSEPRGAAREDRSTAGL